MPPMINMGQLFQRAVSRFPERTAIIDDDGDIRYTYEEWETKIGEVRAALRASGIGEEDAVAVIMENRVELLTVYWATQQVGATFVPLNFRASADEVAFLTNNVAARSLFFSAISREAVINGRGGFPDDVDLVYVDSGAPTAASGYSEFVDRGSEPQPPNVADPDTTSIILHTSGTTGKPKGVVISQAANYARTLSNPVHLNWKQGERTLGIMPNYHEMGRAAISSTALLNGIYVAQRNWSPEQGLELIEREGIEILYLVPTLFHDMVDYEDLDDFDVSSVRRVGYAGTAMSERVHREVERIFEPDQFVNFYGTSEMNCMTSCPWVAEKPGCSGRAGINTAVRVVKAERDESVSPNNVVPPNDLGEIILDASSPEAFHGYLNRPDATERAFEDGWYFTGDLGYRDDDGDIWVVGRVDDLLISGGENIYPIEIENVLDEHEFVGDSAVGCVSDERLGQLVTAFISPSRFDVDWKEVGTSLDAHCRESDMLANFKRPRKYVFLEDLPKSGVGKKLRRKLRVEEIEEIDEGDVLGIVDV